MNKKAAGYIRVSHYRNDEGISPENQKEKIALQAKMLDANLLDIYMDLDVSGKSTDRPEFQRLMKRLDLYDYIIVYKLSRFSRSVHDFHLSMQQLDKHGVTLVSVSENIDTSTPVGRLIRNVLIDFAQFEREVIAEQIRDNLVVNAKRGRWNGGKPPYGYEFKDKQLIPLPTEVDIVKYIFQRFKEGAGANVVRNELFDMGITPPNKQKFWRKNTILEIIRNPVYIGQLRYAGKVYTGQHEAIIDENTWKIAQLKLNERSARAARELGSKHLLSGLIRCSICGKKLNVRYNGKRRVRRYHCPTRNDGVESCKCPILDADSLENAIVEKVFQLINNPEELKGLLESKIASDFNEPQQDIIKKLQMELEQTRNAMKDMFRLYSQKKITEEQLEMMNNEYLKEEVEIKNRLEKFKIQQMQNEAIRLNTEQLLKEALNFRDNWHHASEEEKRELLRQFICELLVVKTGVKIKFLGFGEGFLEPSDCIRGTMFFKL